MDAELARLGDAHDPDVLSWVAVAAEALPLVVALVGAAMWTVSLHISLPGTGGVGSDKGADRLVVVALLPPAYFVAGAGWFLLGRRRMGYLVLALHSAAALVVVFYGIVLINGAGELAGPGPDAPLREFFVSLALSLLIAAISTAWLAADEWKTHRRTV